MGLSIHYQGGINRTQDIPKLITELEDIANSMNWDSQRINDDEPTPDFHGIIIGPTGDCEPLPFIFDKNGKLCCLADNTIEQNGLADWMEKFPPRSRRSEGVERAPRLSDNADIGVKFPAFSCQCVA